MANFNIWNYQIPLPPPIICNSMECIVSNLNPNAKEFYPSWHIRAEKTNEFGFNRLLSWRTISKPKQIVMVKYEVLREPQELQAIVYDRVRGLVDTSVSKMELLYGALMVRDKRIYKPQILSKSKDIEKKNPNSKSNTMETKKKPTIQSSIITKSDISKSKVKEKTKSCTSSSCLNKTVTSIKPNSCLDKNVPKVVLQRDLGMVKDKLNIHELEIVSNSKNIKNQSIPITARAIKKPPGQPSITAKSDSTKDKPSYLLVEENTKSSCASSSCLNKTGGTSVKSNSSSEKSVRLRIPQMSKCSDKSRGTKASNLRKTEEQNIK
ncbi:uncharacterized protein LOC142233958 [Haematobia irritans]|uniref:uncharacterized protein LOC142233958 n=1 Tax=Haematobia irritans TaxID=7368 RepID=UPI003F4F7574